MITYEPGKWSLYFALSLNGSVLPKASVWAVSCAVASMVGHFFLDYVDYDRERSHGSSTLQVLGGFTFILGFLVVFRSQQAYSRWWEGGTLLQQLRGEWFNAFSSLMAFCNPDREFAKEVHVFQHRLVRLMSLLYSSALQQVTTMEGATFELIEVDGFDLESMRFLDNTHDRCEVVLQWIQRLIVEANASEVIKVAPPILSRVYNQLGNGIVNLNNARKISDFPIPFPLAQMLTIMLVCHWVIVGYLCASAVTDVFVSGCLSFIVMLSFWSVNYIAVELEMPFGDDPNDLPLQDMQRDLNRSLRGLLHPLALMHPNFEVTETTEQLIVTEINFDAYISAHVIDAQRPKATKVKVDRKRTKMQLDKEELPGSSVGAAAVLSPGISDSLPGISEEQEAVTERTAERQTSTKSGEVIRQYLSDADPDPTRGSVRDGTWDPTRKDDVAIENATEDFMSNERELVSDTVKLLRISISMDGHLTQMLKELQVISGSGEIDIDRRMPLLSLLPPNSGIREAPRIEREPKALESASSCAACRGEPCRL